MPCMDHDTDMEMTRPFRGLQTFTKRTKHSPWSHNVRKHLITADASISINHVLLGWNGLKKDGRRYQGGACQNLVM